MRAPTYISIAIAVLSAAAAVPGAPVQEVVPANAPIQSLTVSVGSPGSVMQVGQTRSLSAVVLLSMGATRTVGSGSQWQITFGPQIPVGACGTGAVSFSSQVLSIDTSGAFSENWSPSSPNTLAATGSFSQPAAVTDATIDASLSCFSGPPTGSLAASWDTSHYKGTYTFDNASGDVAVVGLTWATSNSSVATVDSFGKVTALAQGDATITAIYGSRCWQMTPGETSCFGTTTGTVSIHVDPAGGGGGGGEEGCASLVLSLTPDSVAATAVHVTATRSGQTIGAFDVPIGAQITTGPGAYQLQFTPPDGYTVAPDQIEFTLACGDSKNIPLKFAPAAPTIDALIDQTAASGVDSQLLKNARARLLAGNATAACNQIKAFMQHVGAQAGHGLGQAEATALLATAASVRTSLGCR